MGMHNIVVGKVDGAVSDYLLRGKRKFKDVLVKVKHLALMTMLNHLLRQLHDHRHGTCMPQRRNHISYPHLLITQKCFFNCTATRAICGCWHAAISTTVTPL